MANKRNNTEASEATDVAFKKISIGKLRTVYRRFGTSIQIGRSKYTINFCSYLFYQAKACDGLCDTMNKQIYVMYQADDMEAMEATLLHEIVHASLSESCVTQIIDWSEHMEEIIVESLTRDLSTLYSLKIKEKFRPA